MQNRRTFLQHALGASLIVASGSPWNTLSAKNKGITKLVILHTNDMHSRIEPFPADDKKYAGRGGMAVRAALIQQIRKEHEHVLLLDSGDIFQGTPYFNFFGGELELKLMSDMQYDAATLGNHDFDNGIEGLLKQLPHATFPFVNSNYNFSNTALHQKISTYKIFIFNTIKVGVLGIGIDLAGLVPQKNYKDIIIQEPINIANNTATFLKEEMKCDYVICLSHLGYKYDTPKISDVVLANNTKNIDLILGGHTHTFMQQPDIQPTLSNKTCIINQAGWAGLLLGKIEVNFCEKNKCLGTNFSQIKI